MKLSIIQKSEIESLPNVTSAAIKKKNFEPTGLFSEQIFGPLKTNKCWCKTSKTPEGQVCPTCGIKITSSNMRRTTFAKIPVTRVIHPVALEILLSFIKIKKLIDKILSAKYGIVIDNVTGEIKLVKSDLQNYDIIDENVKLGLDAIYEMAKYLVKKSSNIRLMTLMKEIIEQDEFFVDYVIVIPPAYRPISVNSAVPILDDINKLYLSILGLKKPILPNYRSSSLYEIQIQRVTLSLHKYVFDSIGKKEGLLRGSMASKRIDFSGRAVIVPESTVALTQAKIPRLILLQLWELEIISELLKRKKFVSFRYAYNYLQDMYISQHIDEEIGSIIDEITTGKIIILNRQPTLHRGSMLAFEVVPSPEFTIGISPLVCDPFNADFDGDHLAIYRPLSAVSAKEASKKMLSINNLFSAADGSLQFSPKQDIIYGLYKLSQNEKGKQILEEIMGHPISSTLTKKQLMKYLSEDVKKDWTILDKLKDIGFAYSLEYPITLSTLDFAEIPVNGITGDTTKDKQILDEHISEIRAKFTMTDVVDSGARASWDQVRQMVTARGYVVDFFGKIIPKFIKNSYSKGLTQEEFFYSCFGTRKALLDTAINVSDSGYLTRRLVYATVNATLGTIEDCDTSGTLPLDVTNSIYKSILYRNYYLEDPSKVLTAKMYKIENENDAAKLLGKRIFLRSPMTCASPQICKTCYGDLYKIHKSKYIGFIASQTLGERSTQLVLRTFHTGGVAQLDSKGEHDDITKAITYVEHVTDKTKEIKHMDDIVNNLQSLYKIYNDYGNLHLVHFETVLGQLIFNTHGNKVVRWRYDIDMNGNFQFENTQKFSVKVVPSIESWFLGMIFQNPKKNFISGLLAINKSKLSILEKIVTGKITEQDIDNVDILIGDNNTNATF